MNEKTFLVAAVLLLLVIGIVTLPTIAAPNVEIGCKNKNYFAKDSVGEPGVDRAHFMYNDEKGSIDYSLDYDLHLSKDEIFQAATVNLYPEPGPSVLHLGYDKNFQTLTADDLTGPLSGSSLTFLRLLMDYRLTYLNLITDQGEILEPIFVNGKCNLPDSLITGLVFNDTNNNGEFDAGEETGLANIQIQVRDGTTYDGYSDGAGFFLIFVNPGTYTISVVIPPGYTNTTPSSVPVFVMPGNGTFVLFGLNWTGTVPAPAIHIEKYTNGVDADTPPGPSIPVGETVEWEYVVTNTGNVDLENINITDDQLGNICTISSLQPGESDICYDSGIAIAGLYTNIGNVNAEYDGTVFSDSDPSHYTGTEEEPAIDIEKHTNGEDADDITGPEITVGNPVTWTYYVTNTGDKLLQNVTITDDDPAVNANISCPDIKNGKITLKKGENITCTATGIAALGQYENNATASGRHGNVVVSDSDLSHYLGVEEKFYSDLAVAKSTSKDAYYLDETVMWTVTVTNNGPDDADDVIVVEDISGLAGVNFINNSTSQGTFDDTIWDVGSLMASKSATLIINTTFDSTGLKTNNVSVSSSNNDPVPGNNNYSDTVEILSEGAVSVNVEKFVSADGTDWYENLEIPYDDDVYWKIVINNRGTMPVDITVNDTLNGTKITPSCNIPTSLDPGNVSVCVIGPQSAEQGIIRNIVEVKGCYDGVCDTDTASAFYEGTIDAYINVEKYVSEDGNEWYPTIAVPAETPVYWKIFIENTGTHTLSLTVEDYLDSESFPLSCPNFTEPLAPGENATCTIDSSPALPGFHENYIEVTGCYDEICGSDNATAEYEGTVTADLVVEKYVSVDKMNWYSNLPQVPVGTDIAWKIFIENTGSHTLDIEVEDYLDASLFDTGCTFPENLTPGENTTCIIDDTATEGRHENYVNLTGCYGDICESSESRATYETSITPPPDVGVNVEKYVSTDRANWEDYIEVLVDTPIWWQFTIYNTGSDDIDILTIDDSLHESLITLDCEEEIPEIIPAGKSYTCTFKESEYAMEEEQHNTVFVDACNGTTDEDSCDFDADGAWYVGDITVDISVTKYVSRDNKTWNDWLFDVPVGSDVYWKIVIENKGTHPLNLTAEDHAGWDWEELELPCIPEVLEAGEETSCVLGPYTAERENVINKIDVTGCYESKSSGEFCDSDDDTAEYYGEIDAAIKVTKYSSGDGTTWYNRWEPQLLVGSDVYWKILIENTGEVPLDLEITDQLDGDEYTPVCDEGSLPTSLGAGESAYCIWNDTAEEGYHYNTVDVQGCFGVYCDWDWHGYSYADYSGVYEPKATLNKDVSSDNLTWGNYVELPFMDTVYWRIEIENTAQHPIDITLTDTYKDTTFTPSCLEGPLPSGLEVGEDAVCTFTTIAEPPDEIIFNWANLEVCYYGFCDYLESAAQYKAYITAELAVNKQVSRDNESWSDEVDVPVGSNVFWKIEVENTGTHTLNITSFEHTYDDQPATTTCDVGGIPSTIDPKEKATCIINGTADYGRHENYVSIQGCDQYYDTICDEKDARAEYTGTINPELKVTKLVSPNGTDWYKAISIPVGSDIYWKITIENTGTHTLDLEVNDTLDSVPFTLSCENFTEPLSPGKTTSCTFGPFSAEAYSHVNDVRVEGCFNWDHPYCNTQVASSSYYGSGAPPKVATVKGFVFNDTDLDGIWNKSYESGLADANVTIANATWSDFMVTGLDGSFSLTVPATGDYVITETNPAGYISTNATPGDNATKWDNDNLNISITALDTVYDDHLFGDVLEESAAKVEGRVFNDENENGTWDAGENGFSGVNVTMEIEDNPMPNTVKTNATGEYQFAVPPGTNVTISSEGPGLAGYYPTSPESRNIAPLSAGDVKQEDFGYSNDTTVAVIYGTVYNDANENEMMDLGEPGLAGANVTLDGTTSFITSCGGPVWCGGFTFKTNDIGTYAVHEDNPPGYRSTTFDTVPVLVELGNSYEINFGDVAIGPSITLNKTTEWNGLRGDGLLIPIGETITWNYTVTNTGNIKLKKVNITDDQLGEVKCTPAIGTLEPGESHICTVTGTAVEGPYENTGNVTADALHGGGIVTDEDTSSYTGIIPHIDIEVNKTVAASESGPWYKDTSIQVPGTAWWNITIKNNGTVGINLSIEDYLDDDPDKPFPLCEGFTGSLGPGESRTCINSTIAVLGQHFNNVSVTASNEIYEVDPDTESDKANYTGISSEFATITACKQNETESSLPKWRMILGDPSGKFVNGTTDLEGCTVFTVYESGNYTLSEDVKSGWVPVVPLNKPVFKIPVEVSYEGTNYPFTFTNRELPEEYATITACKHAFVEDQDPVPLTQWVITITNKTVTWSQATNDLTGCTVFSVNSTGNWTVSEEKKDGWYNISPTERVVNVTMLSEEGEPYLLKPFLNSQTIKKIDIDVEKYVSNSSTGPWHDADTLEEIVPIRSDVYDEVWWNITVTNKGTIRVDLDITDFIDGNQTKAFPLCEGFTGSLGPGESRTCINSTPIEDLIHFNYVAVNATNESYPEMSSTDTDLAWYFGGNSTIEFGKFALFDLPGLNLTQKAIVTYFNQGLYTYLFFPDLEPWVIPAETPLNWTYLVINTGTSPLKDVVITDDKLGTICEAESLVSIPDLDVEFLICHRNGTVAQLGEHTNVGTLSGTINGENFETTSEFTYTGVPPLVMSKMVWGIEDLSWSDLFLREGSDLDQDMLGIIITFFDMVYSDDEPPGWPVPIGIKVNWTYAVLNIGFTRLHDVEISDDKVGFVCSNETLDPAFIYSGSTNFSELITIGDSLVCFANDISIEGQYENNGTVTAINSTEYIYTAYDLSHYNGTDYFEDFIEVEKTVSDNPGGPWVEDISVPVGSEVWWNVTIRSKWLLPYNLTLEDYLDDDVNKPVTFTQWPDEPVPLPGYSNYTLIESTLAEQGEHFNNVTVHAEVPGLEDIDPWLRELVESIFGEILEVTISDRANYTGISGDNATITAIVFKDSNRNGVQDSGEGGLSDAAVTLRLDGDLVGQKTTGTSGEVSFTGLEADTYQLRVVPPSARWVLTSGTSLRDVTVGEDETVEETFGYRYRGRPGPGPKPPVIGGELEECDFIENGTLTINEEGLNLRTITICAVDGIGRLIIYEDSYALNATGAPLEWAVIIPETDIPDPDEGCTFTGYGYVTGPADATFDSPATIKMIFNQEEWAEIGEMNLSIKFWNAGTGTWEEVFTTVDPATRTVAGVAERLGIYALFDCEPPVIGPPIIEPIIITTVSFINWLLPLILWGIILLITLGAYNEGTKKK